MIFEVLGGSSWSLFVMFFGYGFQVVFFRDFLRILDLFEWALAAQRVPLGGPLDSKVAVYNPNLSVRVPRRPQASPKGHF